ncbi:MAG: hypothetical protein AAGF93_09465 [Cyanobacteria bacterium P01_H01_bin.105]
MAVAVVSLELELSELELAAIFIVFGVRFPEILRKKTPKIPKVDKNKMISSL